MNKNELLKVFSKLEIEYVNQSDEWLMCKCPLAPWSPEHAKGFDNRPSFGVHIKDGGISKYNCFTCHRTGTMGGLAMQLSRNLDDPVLLAYGKELDQQEILGGVDEFEWNEAGPVAETQGRVTAFPNEREYERRYPSVLTSPDALRYLRGRGINLSTCVALDLRYDDRQERILFPVRDYWTGRYCGCSGRIINGPTDTPKVRDYFGLEKDRLVLGKLQHRSRNGRRLPERSGSGQRSLRLPSFIIVVEGLFAYARLVQLGFGSFVLAILGSKLLPLKLDIILDIGLPVYWFTDNDPAGRSCLYGYIDKKTLRHKGNGALENVYKHLPCFIPAWPEDKTDPDELTRAEVDYMIETATLYSPPVNKLLTRPRL